MAYSFPEQLNDIFYTYNPLPAPCCAVCGRPANIPCKNNCYFITHPIHRVWYCNEQCRDLHQVVHQPTCSFAALYYTGAHLFTFDIDHPSTTGLEGVLTALKMRVIYGEIDGLTMDMIASLAEYLHRVVWSARPEQIHSGRLPRLRGQVLERIENVKTRTLEEHVAYVEHSVSQELKAKWETAVKWMVPFDCRSVVEVKAFERYEDWDGTTKYAMELFPQDYDKLDYPTYLMIFGGGKRQTIDPFRRQTSEQDRIVEEA